MRGFMYDRDGIYISIGVTACMMILWWRFLVRLADDRSDGMDSMHGELGSQVKFNRTPSAHLHMISPGVNRSSDRLFSAVRSPF